MAWLKRKFVLLFSIDLRSLAALRMGLGALLLVDLGTRLMDLEAHYTDEGVLPRALISKFPYRSIHFFSGEVAWQAALFGVAAVAAFLLLLGYRTRLATCVSWLLLVSLQTRTPLLINGGDVLLRMLLFWAMFLPIGRVWSLDARRKHQAWPRDNAICSIATVAILLQVFLMYWLTGYFKNNEVWHNGLGLHYALSLDAYARPLAGKLLEYPAMLKGLSHVTLWFELIAPVLLFLPWGTKAVRCVLLVVFMLFHLGIEMCLTVGLFSYVSMFVWVLFLPDTFWDLFQKTKCEQRPSRDAAPAVPSHRRRSLDMISQAVCGAALVYVLLWNYSTTSFPGANHAMPYRLKSIGTMTKVGQYWNMFGPAPVRDGWCVALARLNDGESVDLLRDGRPVDWSRPPTLIDLNPNHRWRKYFRVLIEDKNQRYRSPLCRYLAYQWDQSHPPRRAVRVVELYFMEELTLPPGQGIEESQLLLHREVLTSDSSLLDNHDLSLPGMKEEVPGRYAADAPNP